MWVTIFLLFAVSAKKYIGCYDDNGDTNRTLPFTASHGSDLNTQELCLGMCAQAGYGSPDDFAGVEWGTQCFCGHSLPSWAQEAPDKECRANYCAGDPNENCGGAGRLLVMQNKDPTDCVVTVIQGCVNDDGDSDRALEFTAAEADPKMTQERCANLCNAAGYGQNDLNGVEYGGQCFCGEALASWTKAQPKADCEAMPCTGNSSEFCGGINRLFIFQSKCVPGPPTPVPAPTPPTPPPTPSRPAFYNSCTENFSGGVRLSYDFCNQNLTLEQRIADLLKQMTPREKTDSLYTDNPKIPRLGVPSLPGGEGLHGVASGCGLATSGTSGCPTSFPAAISMGAAFDQDLYQKVGAAIGLEARALNNQGVAGIYLFTPNINPVRDPRWGRAQEVPSEDPNHAAEYGVAYITGFQNGPDSKYLQAAATAKHSFVYDLEGYIPRTDPPRPKSAVCDSAGGCQRWNFDGSPPQDLFMSYFAFPFERAVKEAKVRAIMCSYNAAFGKPTCANDDLNNQLVRKQWGFEGFFVSDCSAIELMQNVTWDNCPPPYPPAPGQCTPNPFPGHSYTTSTQATARAALVDGGVDYNCGPFYKVWLYDALQKGAVSQSDVDQAVARVYTTHFLLGLLDPMEGQYYVNVPPSVVDSADHRALALRAAHEAMTLLKNDGGLLPLKKSLKFAFIGPHADANVAMLSNYHGDNKLVFSHSPLQAASAKGLNVVHARGCNICDVVPPGYPNMPCPPGQAFNTSGFDEAVAVAKAADVAVVFVGSDQTTEAENFDRDNLTLAGVQEQLVKLVAQAQPRTVVVFIHGGAIASPWIKDNIPAILDAFYPGELGGDAIVDTLVGDNNPGGKMPYTTYFNNFTSRDIRDVDLRSSGGVTHLYFSGPVLFPYGFGLSYTSFSYAVEVSTIRLSIDALRKQGGLASTVTVANTGRVSGDCVVLAFVSCPAVVYFPIKSLANFTRVRALKQGESRSFVLSMAMERFSVALPSGKRILMPANCTVRVGDLDSVSIINVELYGSEYVLDDWGKFVSHK